MNLVPAQQRDFEVAILRLSGRLDTLQEPDVSEWLDIQTSTGLYNLVVNLSDVDFIDSAGLTTLAQGAQLSRKGGGDLLLCGLSPAVHTIFALSRMDQSIQIYDNEADAIIRLLARHSDQTRQ